MVICLDVRYRVFSGASTVINNLVPFLIKENKDFEFVLLQYENQKVTSDSTIEKIIVPKTNSIIEIAWIQIILPIILKKMGCKLYVSLKQPVGPFFSKVPKIFFIQHILGNYKSDKFPVSWKVFFYWMILGKPNIIKSDRLIAVSEFVKECIVGNLHYPENKIDVIYNGVSQDYKILSQSEIKNEKRRLCPDRKILLCCGNVVPVKNHETAIRAFKIIKDKHPEFMLVIAGNNKTKHYNLLKNEIKKLNLEEDVLFTGFVEKEDLVKLYNLAELLLLPSLTESFSLAAIEALSCGLPIIASNRGAIKTVCGKCAKYIDDPNDYKAFAQSICELIEGDDREKFLKNAEKRLQQFSWQQSAIQYLASFKKTISDTL